MTDFSLEAIRERAFGHKYPGRSYVPRDTRDDIAHLLAVNEALAAALERNLNWLTSYPGGGTMLRGGPYDQSRAALALYKNTATEAESPAGGASR